MFNENPSHVARKFKRLASQAAKTAGVELTTASNVNEFEMADKLFRTIWGGQHNERYAHTDLYKAITHTGGHVGLATLVGSGEIVGASLALTGRDSDGVFLHGDLLGVEAEHRDRGVGYALKSLQAEWALSETIDTIQWTFNPLQKRNAFFNLQKLGCQMESFKVEFYSESADSDRLIVRWHPESELGRLERNEKKSLISPNDVEDGVMLIKVPERETITLLERETMRENFRLAFDARMVFLGLTASGEYVFANR